jgi:ribA/ribD-fused uncharacterized protein
MASRTMMVKRELHFFGPSGDLGWLDPMYPCRFNIDGVMYRSVEHYYQSRRARGDDDRKWIADAPDGMEAERRARSLSGERIVEGWNLAVKLGAMRDGTFAKFAQDKRLERKLIDTGNATLCRDREGDGFWSWPGKNMVGVLLMEVRETLRLGFH